MSERETSTSLFKIFVRQYARNKLALSAAFILTLLFLAAIAGPWLARIDPDEIHLDEIYQSPSVSHPFGTDMNGRDVFARVLYGARISMSVGFISSGLAGIIGVLVGALAGFFGGKIDSLLMRLVDLILSIPSFFLLLMVIAMLEPNIYNVMIVIALTSWPGLARLVRAEVLSVRERDYIQAAIALGIGRWRIIWRHIIPNVMAPVFVA
ncbi:peptide ABC transporter permease, partial [candidate division KSB1 bacterium 4484_87]